MRGGGLTRRQLERWFPDDEVVALSDDALPAEVSDPRTRELLTRVGVPESFLEALELDVWSPGRDRPMRDVYLRHGEAPPDGVDGLCYLGFAGPWFLAVEGTTGRVCQVGREFGVRPLASDLDAFFRVLGCVSRRIRRSSRRRAVVADDLAAAALRHLRRLDPAALPAAEPAWRSIVADAAANVS